MIEKSLCVDSFGMETVQGMTLV